MHLKDKDSWEQARMLAFTTAQVNSTKKLKVTDIISFPWDEKSNGTETTVSREDMERLRTKAQQYLKTK